MRTRTMTTTALGPVALGSPSPQKIRWGAVFGGAVLGTALLALLATLWFALAYGSEVDRIRTNLEWYIGGSAIASLFVAGLLAGWLSGVHGAGSGFFNGVTIWGLMLLITVTVGVPAVLNVLNVGRVTPIDTSTFGLLDPRADTVLWASFAAIVGGLLASGLGGAIGGAVTRPANARLVDDAVARQGVGQERPARPDTRTIVVPQDEDERIST